MVSLDFPSISTPLSAHTYTIVCKGWSVPTHETEGMGEGAKVTLFRVFCFQKTVVRNESEKTKRNCQLIAADGVGFIRMIVRSDLQRFPRQVRIFSQCQARHSKQIRALIMRAAALPSVVSWHAPTLPKQ